MRHARAAGALLLLMLGGCHRHDGELRVDRAWVRLAAVTGRPAAGYLTIHGGATPGRLIAVDSPDAGSSELHESTTSGQGMASMRRLDGVDVAAGGEVAFAPGGYHVMLFGVGPQVTAGGAMPLTVRFARGDPIAVTAKVVSAGDPAPY